MQSSVTFRKRDENEEASKALRTLNMPRLSHGQDARNAAPMLSSIAKLASTGCCGYLVSLIPEGMMDPAREEEGSRREA
jgi:hypothetical protein